MGGHPCKVPRCPHKTSTGKPQVGRFPDPKKVYGGKTPICGGCVADRGGAAGDGVLNPCAGDRLARTPCTRGLGNISAEAYVPDCAPSSYPGFLLGAVVFCRPHESLRREQLERAGVAAAPPTAGGKRCFGDMFTGEDCTLGMSGGPRTASFPSPLPLDDPDYVRGAAVYCSTHGGSPGHAINEVIFEAVLAVARQKGREWLSRGLVLLPQKRVCDKYYIDVVIANPLVAHRVAEETDEGPHLVGSAPAEVRCVLRALDGGPPPPFSAPQARPSPATVTVARFGIGFD